MKETLCLSYCKIREFITRMRCELNHQPIPPMRKHPAGSHKWLYNIISQMTPETFVSALFTGLGVIVFILIRLIK